MCIRDRTVTDVIAYELLRRHFHIGNFCFWAPLFKQLLLKNCAVDFVEICNVCSRKVIIKAAKRIFNSDKICCSYYDFYFGVTFFGTHCICIGLWCRPVFKSTGWLQNASVFFITEWQCFHAPYINWLTYLVSYLQWNCGNWPVAENMRTNWNIDA